MRLQSQKSEGSSKEPKRALMKSITMKMGHAMKKKFTTVDANTKNILDASHESSIDYLSPSRPREHQCSHGHGDPEETKPKWKQKLTNLIKFMLINEDTNRKLFYFKLVMYVFFIIDIYTTLLLQSNYNYIQGDEEHKDYLAHRETYFQVIIV